MVITFYRTMDDYRVLNKTLGTALGSATGVLHERVSDTQLSIKVPSSFFNYITQSNYVMIDTFQKYYFLNTICNHGVKKNFCSINIIFIVFKRIYNTFTNK